MLGLDGFVLLAVSQHDGELEQAIETTATEGFCPCCGVQARLHDRRPTWVRDLPAGGRPVTLVWVKRIWRCVDPGAGGDLVGDLVGDPAAGVVDRAGPGRRVGGSGRTGIRWPRWRPRSGSPGAR